MKHVKSRVCFCRDLVRLQKIFSQIPHRLTQKTKYSHYDADARTNEVKHLIDLLTKARVSFPVVRSHCNGVPLSAESDEKSFKLLFYVIARNGGIYPVEVKAGKSGTLKSLHQYLLQKGGKIAFRFDMNQPGRQELEPSIRIGGTQNETDKVAFSLISLPLYAVEELNRICDHINTETRPGREGFGGRNRFQCHL